MASRRFRNAARRGVAAAIEHGAIPLPPHVRTVIDVGSHTGQFAIFALERFPEAKVVCLEPLAGPRAKLLDVITGEDADRVTVLPYAASNESGEHEFHVSRAEDSSSLLPIAQRYVDAFPGTEEANGTRVQTARLDDLGIAPARPSLLKVDVQGSELEVLEGAVELLTGIDYVIVECSFVELYIGQALAGDVVAALHAHSFDLGGAYGVKRDRAGYCLQSDLFFRRR
jgi:FkbM family methyltransferase